MDSTVELSPITDIMVQYTAEEIDESMHIEASETVDRVVPHMCEPFTTQVSSV